MSLSKANEDPWNPLKLVYDKLWDIVEKTDLATLVKAGNREKFDKHNRGTKRQVKTGDFPELKLAISTGNFQLPSDSSSGMMIERFTWLLSSGDWGNDDFLHLKWLLQSSHMEWITDLTALTWDGLPFVTRCSLLDSLSGTDNSEASRLMNAGWSSVLTVEVQMHFGKATLAKEINP